MTWYWNPSELLWWGISYYSKEIGAIGRIKPYEVFPQPIDQHSAIKRIKQEKVFTLYVSDFIVGF